MVRIQALATASILAVEGVLSAGVQLEKGAIPPPSWVRQVSISPQDIRSKQIELTFAVKQSNIDVLHETLMSVSNPDSPSYGKLLSLDEINKLTQPSNLSLETVKEYLNSHGVNESDVSYSSGFLRAVVDINTAESMLSASYSLYKHVLSEAEVIRCDGYSLPIDIAEHLDFVSPTVNFPPSSLIIRNTVLSETTHNTPESLRDLYNVGNTMGHDDMKAKQGVTAFLHQYYLESDLQYFYENYFDSLSGVPLSSVIGPNKDKAGLEASLDVQYMSTLGGGVPTEFWSFPGRQPDAPENEPFLDWLFLLGNTSNPPLVFSTSYGEDESSVSLEYANRMNEEFQKNSLRGISFLFASGDSGVGSMTGSCEKFEPMFPADSPYVTAVGATTKINPEEGASLSSGGFSYRWSRPSWQDKAVENYFSTSKDLPPSELYNSDGRAFPDVSAQGTSYVVVNNNTTIPGVSGTSASSPTFAGIIALINDARVTAGKSPMGFLNPFIYKNPSIFNDVTIGHNPGCGTDGFFATKGWDPVTGYGTPNFSKMLSAAMALP